MSYPHNFASLAGDVPASYLDDNFNAAAQETAFSALSAEVAALPSSSTPLEPTAAGSAGSATDLSKSDHQHPTQRANINLQTGTSYTLAPTDNGATLEFNNASAVAVTVPTGLGAEFNCLLVQVGAGQVTFTAGGGMTQRQASSLTKTRAQWSEVTLYVRGSATEYVLGGDMA